MKKLLFLLILIFSLIFNFTNKVFAISQPVTLPSCGCPLELNGIYSENGESCVGTYEEFENDPVKNHFWVQDEEITTQGKADERARQFLYWVITHPSIDNHPTLLKIWSTTRNLSYFFVILIAAAIGIGMIINQKTNFSASIKIWPSIWKLLLALLYISFSASLVITIIQLSEVLMKFFIENLGGRQLFNIYFGTISEEENYVNFLGCRDLNLKVQEAFKAEVFLLKLTNISYYVMGTMLILRKILLWFLLFVSPFLALLMPFVFIRNIGWIWIGVFFQWVFYGPLFALFLGGLTLIWQNGIPFAFDFSRVGKPEGYIYPTAFNILYGGPAQQLAILNNGNYVDTFAEYVITLIMLWAVTFFPWWLLRIFRDYCCDGIYAMKNILMSLYDQMRAGPSPSPTFPVAPAPVSTTIKIPKQVAIPIKTRLETIEEIKRTKTEEIARSLNISVSKLTDIAHFETNRQIKETVTKNLNYLQNPYQAVTASEKQKYMNIRNELFNRAVKEDRIARQILSSISQSKVEQLQQRQQLLKSIPQTTPITHLISIKVNIPAPKTQSITSSFIQSTIVNQPLITQVAQKSQTSIEQTKSVLTSLNNNINKPLQTVIPTIAQETNTDKKTTVTILKNFFSSVKENKEILKNIAQSQQMKVEEIEKIATDQLPMVVEPEKHIEKTISIPPSVPIEEYEEVKHMWENQYEKGEVPISENITSRKQWLEKDIVFITNTLNKLLSSDKQLQQEGLDDLGFILPIFLINNLTSEQLIVYLKAKLEAAKQVLEEKEKEEEITEKLKSQEEEKVEVAKPKEKEAEKIMEMEEEINPEEKKPNN